MKDITNSDSLNGLTITQIETEVDNGLRAANKHLLGSIKRLYYLETTGRYKENERYKDSTFSEYLKFRYLMSTSLYHSRKVAVLGHPNEVEKHGEAVVSIVRRRCGVVPAKKVFQEIEEMPPEKRTPAAIEKVLSRYEKPSIPSRPSTIAGTRNENTRLRTELQEARQTIRSLELLLEERDKQIEKLVASVNKYKKNRAAA